MSKNDRDFTNKKFMNIPKERGIIMKIIKKSITIITMLAIMLTLALPMTAQAKEKPKLNKLKVTINVKKSYQLKVKGTSKKAKWTTSNKKVVAVNSKGKITAKKKGTAKITAKVSGKRYTCKVTVKQPVTSIALNKKTATLTKKGATVSLKATAKPTNANNRKVTWKSSNTKVAKVSSKGVVTAVANGTATITATATDSSKKKATCKITVKIPGGSGNTTTPTECEHNWVAVTKTKTVHTCSCGIRFDNAADWSAHNMDMKINHGETHSFSTNEITVINHYKCSKCGKTKSAECEHNWVAHETTKNLTIICNCGARFDTNEDFSMHSFEMACQGDENHNSYSSSITENVDYYTCSKCGATKAAN